MPTPDVVPPASAAAPPRTGSATVRNATEMTEYLVGQIGDRLLVDSALATVTDEQREQLLVAAESDASILDFEPERAPLEQFDAIVVFSFGNRVAADGTVSAGPTNRDLAIATAALLEQRAVTVYAQWEVAEHLAADGVDDLVSIEPDIGADGSVVYLSTAGVFEKAARLASESGRPFEHVGVVGFADHAVRCVLTVRASGVDAAVPIEAELPDTYDPESGQAWTRSRPVYLPTDLVGRLILLQP